MLARLKPGFRLRLVRVAPRAGIRLALATASSNRARVRVWLELGIAMYSAVVSRILFGSGGSISGISYILSRITGFLLLSLILLLLGVDSGSGCSILRTGS